MNIPLFRSLFRGRSDVFAVRWEKAGKSGYMPSYIFDPYRYKAHQLKGGSFQNFTEKKFQPLNDEQIRKHLNGELFIGVYPLLVDNTSWFIAADFDGERWIQDIRKFLACCKTLDLPVYLERSRSGKGGHIWLFFDRPYPAFKSRKIFQQILVESGAVSVFDKNSSFDRLFPNQDALSGKGLGNLIALPLNRKSLDEKNGCFIDQETLVPFEDQWKFLSEVERISTEELDILFHSKELKVSPGNTWTGIESSDDLTISLSNILRLNKNAIPHKLTNYLKEELNFANEEYFIKKNSGKNVYGTTKYFRLIEENGNQVIIPKGFAGKLLRFCKDNQIPCKFVDNRIKLSPVNFNFQAELKFYQEPAAAATARKDLGIIVAPPGSGKTIIALKIIAEKRQPALIIVHRKQLLDQWKERIESFLGIPRQQIGIISNGKWKPGNHITIATIQSLAKQPEGISAEKFTQSFGTIIVDECHHIPAETFRKAIQMFNSYFLYGLTATPFRKYNDGKMIFIFLGEVIREIKTADAGNIKNPVVVIRNTSLNTPFNSKTDEFEVLSKILIHDTDRNRMILQDIIDEVGKGKRVIVLTERKDHIDSLYLYLKQQYKVVTLSGEDSDVRRSEKWKLLQDGNYQILITTGQFFGEGTDLTNASCLFLVYPFSFEGKLIQYIGRVQRSEIAPTIYDYRDIRIEYLNKMFL